MVDAPAPGSRKKFIASRGAVRVWLIAVIVMPVVIGVAWFLGDVPNRYRAHQAMREGRVALLASDLPKALGYFRQAAAARPADEAVAQQYDQTQSRWVEMVDEKAADLAFADAYLELQPFPSTETLLVEPHLGRYRNKISAITRGARTTAGEKIAEARARVAAKQFEEALALLHAVEPFQALVPELPARIQEVRAAQLEDALAVARAALEKEKFADARRALQPVASLGAGHEDYRKLGPAIDEAEVRAALREASSAAKKFDFVTASKHLARAAEVNVLTEDVTKAQAEFRDYARGALAFELARQLAANNRTAVEAALEQGRIYAGWESVPAERLLTPASLPDFLQSLEAFELGPKAMEKYVDRLDVPLVLYCRAKFPRAEVDEFLRDSLVRWSRYAFEQKCPAIALFLDDQSRNYGASADAAWRKTALASAIASTPVTVAVADAQPDPKAPAGLNAAATTALRDALRPKLTGWPKYVEYDAARGPTVALVGSFGGFDSFDDRSNVTRKTVRYQSGTRQVPNPEEQSVYDEYRDLLDRRNNIVAQINDKQAYVDQVNANPNADYYARSLATNRAIEVAGDRMLVNQWNSKLNELRQYGQSLPKTLSEPVYADEPYQVIKHVYTCALNWAIVADLPDEPIDVAFHSAKTTFRTEEVVGNASRGVPVRAPQPVPREQLTKDLVKPLVAAVGKVDDVLKALPGVTLQAVARLNEKAIPLKQVDQYLTVVYAWESQYQKVERKEEVMAFAKQILSLP